MSDKLDSFEPSLRNTHGRTWEASIRLPIVGDVTTRGNGWEEAKMRLWLVSEAVKQAVKLSEEYKDVKDWSESEWRSALTTMRRVMDSPERKSKGVR